VVERGHILFVEDLSLFLWCLLIDHEKGAIRIMVTKAVVLMSGQHSGVDIIIKVLSG